MPTAHNMHCNTKSKSGKKKKNHPRLSEARQEEQKNVTRKCRETHNQGTALLQKSMQAQLCSVEGASEQMRELDDAGTGAQKWAHRMSVK